jgi:hypothetical protein
MLLAETFYELDQSPGDPRVSVLLRRMEGGVYTRLAGNAAEAAGLLCAPAPDAFNAPKVSRNGRFHFGGRRFILT